MSIYDFYKRTMGNTNIQNGSDVMTIGQQFKNQSDMVMEQTWWHDPQSKVCYIYDYFHDDQPDKKDHMTYENTTKTRIDAKFIIKTYQSIDKEQIDYYIQFRPSQKMEFNKDDELYYYETDYRNKINSEFPLGLYCDIPDDKGVYRKWLIAFSEPANQFPKYLLLPINYQLMWIEQNSQEKIKRKMWCVLRGQSSYNSGVYTDYTFTKMENQEKCWLPFNRITEKLWYVTESNKNMRILISSMSKHPLAWIISKVENMQPFGIQKLTFYQDHFNSVTDYVNLDTKEMFADYYKIPQNTIVQNTNCFNSYKSDITCKIITSTPTLKIGGSYKLLVAKVYQNGNNITDQLLSSIFEWSAFINGIQVDSVIIWKKQPDSNMIKIKFADERMYLGNKLLIKCAISNFKIVGECQLELIV